MTSTPVVSLVHHVHREQWPVVFPRPVAAVGWALESRVAPAMYRGRQYVTVSSRTREELVDLGVDHRHVSVIHNGTDPARALAATTNPHPTVLVLGRLVPHKRVELAVDVVAHLRREIPDIHLRIVGAGWWRERIQQHIEVRGVADNVTMLGFVDEDTKARELSAAWVAIAPSAKEGWGLGVVEAGAYGVPTIAHHGAGGLSESILDGRTGVLVHDTRGLIEATRRLVVDDDERTRLGSAARVHAQRFTWESAVANWEWLLRRTASGANPTSAIDPLDILGAHGSPRLDAHATLDAIAR